MKKILISLAVVCLLFSISACAASGGNGEAGFGENDLIFVLNDKEFVLDGDVSALISELGDGFTLYEAPSCLYDGTDKTFEYVGVTIYTYPLNGKDLIDEIQLTDGTYSTSKDISVGSTTEDVIEAYGEDYADEGGIITYRMVPDDAKSPCLYFITEGGIVTGISYYSASNM